MRVSKTWDGVITNSPAIQQALYFRPISTATTTSTEPVHLANDPESGQVNGWDPTSDKVAGSWPVLNPLLMKKFGRCFFDFEGEYGYHRRAGAFYRLSWTARACEADREVALKGEDLGPQPSGRNNTSLANSITKILYSYADTSKHTTIEAQKSTWHAPIPVPNKHHSNKKRLALTENRALLLFSSLFLFVNKPNLAIGMRNSTDNSITLPSTRFFLFDTCRNGV
ncbi:uncharacterized protein BP5553_09623 [Venustampulla echinocandica]|uniref:Uncharacterized protein n=1 Tax=Venustampulla echinocandica TaxID=2656787 RepID=A0A370TBI3_9HELO|nr:uncharacterized protein BP5553_09623 [Venustampulla echinocandica]RDL31414.1 hypothetical protein BP5553_09623 [Venustampulla echinocandica]